MLDQSTKTRMIRRQRVAAEARVGFACREGATVLRDLRQQGAAKAILPKVHRPDPELVFLNTAGGLTAGDRIRFELALAPGARATATTQTAERAYASLEDLPPAQMEVALSLGAGAALDWLPQETILFDRAALHRTTRAELSGDARLLMCEMIVLGRAAMGETLQSLRFRDWREVRRAGRPVLIEPLDLSDASLARREAAAGLGGARAMATLALIAPDAPDLLPRLQDHPAPGVTAAASAWDGKLILRGLAQDASPLRHWLQTAITEIRGQSLPRVWTI